MDQSPELPVTSQGDRSTLLVTFPYDRAELQVHRCPALGYQSPMQSALRYWNWKRKLNVT